MVQDSGNVRAVADTGSFPEGETMRLKISIAFLGLVMMLGILGGCGGNANALDRSGISGAVVSSAGIPIPNTAVTLSKNGQQVGQPSNTNANGNFSFSNIPAGSYAVQVAAGTGNNPNVQSIVGPFNLTSSTTMIMTAPTAADLGVTNPATTTTLVVRANTTGGTQVKQFTVTIGPVTISNSATTPATVVFPGITTTFANVVISANNTTATLNVGCTPGSVVFLQAVLPNGR